MPIFIQEKRVYDQSAYLKHKNLMNDFTMCKRLVRGGHIEYKTELQNLKHSILLNKYLAK